MNICKICRQDIQEGDMMAIVSFPVKCTGPSGDYSYFGDFSHNEQHVHDECLREVASQLIEILCGKRHLKPKAITVEDEPQEDPPEVDNVSGRRLFQALDSLDIDTDIEETTNFVKDHPNTPLEELIRVWFQKQDQVV